MTRERRSDDGKSDEINARLNRYRPLTDYLVMSAQPEVVLTFAEIEVIIGSPLPDQARADASYWASNPHGIRCLLEPVAWKARLDRRSHRVRFTRIGTQERPKRGMCSYQPLRDYLARSAERSLVLTFAEIEEMLGCSLPVSVYVDQSRWVNAVRAVGWQAHLDRHNQCVTFTRVVKER